MLPIPPTLPPIQTRDLNGRSLSIPSELPAERTVLLVAFEREQQGALDAWAKGLDLRIDGSGLPWVEMPVVGRMPGLAQGFINSGMRSGIPEEAKRAHVVTLYTDAVQWRKAVGLPSGDRVYVLVVDKAGRVLARQDGPYETAKRGKILDAMRWDGPAE